MVLNLHFQLTFIILIKKLAYEWDLPNNIQWYYSFIYYFYN